MEDCRGEGCMSDVLPIFKSHYSLGKSLLTLEEPGKTKPGNPVSVFDLAMQANLKEIFLCENRIDGFLQAYKVASKVGVKLCYGLKLTVCANMGDKTVESRLTESKIVILFHNTQSYFEAIRIWNRAWGHEGSFTHRGITYGRTDWKTLKEFWTENLGLALPYFSSFIARNTLSFSRIVPELPVGNPWIFREMGSELPFAPLIDSAIDRYTGGVSDMILPSKTILYPDPSWFKSYVTFRSIHGKKSFDAPDEDHLFSDRFNFQAWKEMQKISS